MTSNAERKTKRKKTEPKEDKEPFDPGANKHVFVAKFLHDRPGYVARDKVATCHCDLAPMEMWTQGKNMYLFCEVQLSFRTAAHKIHTDQQSERSGPDMFHLQDEANRIRMVVWGMLSETCKIQVYMLDERGVRTGDTVSFLIKGMTNVEITRRIVGLWRDHTKQEVERTVILAPVFRMGRLNVEDDEVPPPAN